MLCNQDGAGGHQKLADKHKCYNGVFQNKPSVFMNQNVYKSLKGHSYDFTDFFVKTVLKLSVANFLSMPNICVWTFKGTY